MLPDDDRDRQLARRLGEARDAGRPFEAPDDALFQSFLDGYRTRRLIEPLPEGTSARLWAGIEPRLGQDRPARPRAVPRRTLALAAVVAVLVAVGWWLLRPQAPVLLAEAGAQAHTLTLADGSTVTLRPGSRLFALDASAPAVRLHLDGEAFFDVVPDASRPFSVEAGAARVTVLGTRFVFSGEADEAAVFLAEGRVRFEHVEAGTAVVLAPGEASRLTAEGRLLPPAPAAEETFTDWMRGELRFERRALGELLAELGRHYSIAFDVPAALRAETVSGRILLGTRDEALADLGRVLGGRFVAVDATTYRFVQED